MALASRSQIRRFSFALACLVIGFVAVVVLSHLGYRLSDIMVGTPAVSA
jgi:hypothetical protein